MMRTLVPLLLLSATPAFADEPALKGNVLVWNDAAFYTDAADDAQVVHAASLDSRTAGNVIAMKVISTKNGFVEVEPAAELDCTWARLQTSDDLAQLHLFVKRADLAPVLSVAFDKTYNDGSHVALKPGTPVTSADGKYTIGVRGTGDIALELPEKSVGWSYLPEKVKTGPTILGGEFELAPKTKVSLADAAIVIDARRGVGIEQRGAQTVFSIKSKCAALDVVAPAKSVRSVEDDEEQTMEVSSGLAVMDLRNEDFIPQGTILSTVGGRAFAAAAKPIYLSAVPHGKAACVDRKIKIGVFEGESQDPKDGDNKLKVCAPATRVMHEQLRSARSANGTTHR
ncbi:MAG: hypothetical protein QM831_21080 [Kofleriaceae bacterium]